jgi:endoglucanase
MRRISRLLIVGACLGLALVAMPGVTAGEGEGFGDMDLYVPKRNHGAVEQIADLVSSSDKESAARVTEMNSTPRPFWVEVTDPAATMRQVRATVKHAAAKKQLPVLVAYSIPFRDCAQFSAGAPRAWPSTPPGSMASPPASATCQPS